ncbi:unnamed protein product [Caenorhabditis auriculariae]|uniref:UPAR/Ly6 domain-containing protein n=1 Tax=Caenorhabditis auriculariae TaxID=2777116 RepID=A0A8S1HYH1_9PELO|nr:unnamed protein product [Caenorhabditis auriculariae]
MKKAYFQGKMESLLLLFIAVAAFANTVEGAANCSVSGELSCFSCMGRDMENCRSGLTCCKGACFKLQDLVHNVMVKGCVDTKEEDASMKVRELNVPLYWADNEKVKGESFFCNSKDFCNSALRQDISLIFAAISLVFTHLVL